MFGNNCIKIPHGKASTMLGLNIHFIMCTLVCKWHPKWCIHTTHCTMWCAMLNSLFGSLMLSSLKHQWAVLNRTFNYLTLTWNKNLHPLHTWSQSKPLVRINPDVHWLVIVLIVGGIVFLQKLPTTKLNLKFNLGLEVDTITSWGPWLAVY